MPATRMASPISSPSCSTAKRCARRFRAVRWPPREPRISRCRSRWTMRCSCAATRPRATCNARSRGLVAAHEHGIVHRDLKPENLFLTRGGVLKILDFGIAQLPRESSGLDRVRTATGAPIGTVSYMSPEQVRGQQVDARSDLFSLGSVLHEMLSGAPPFDRATVLDTGHAVIAEAAP